MALRISKAHRETLNDMVLAHRVAVRAKAKANLSDGIYYDLMDRVFITQYALDVALGGGDVAYKLQYLRHHGERGHTDAQVALIRLNALGVNTDWGYV